MKIIKLTLAERDQCIKKIESQIEDKKNILIEKQKLINKNVKFNQLLEHIRNDYHKYYNYIIQQKREQIQAMNILNSYIRELSNSGSLSKNNLKDSKFEENKILNEIKHIEHSMNHLIKQLKYPDNTTSHPSTISHSGTTNHPNTTTHLISTTTHPNTTSHHGTISNHSTINHSNLQETENNNIHKSLKNV